MKEREFMASVVELARYSGYGCVYHTHRSEKSSPGFPDLVLARTDPPDFLMAELKSDFGRLSPDQSLWLTTLRRAGVDVYLWAPKDMDEIVLRLSRRKRRTPIASASPDLPTGRPPH
jgi:VRR-NUC domain